MKNYLLFIFLVFSQLSFSQIINVLPKDENGKIIFTRIIDSNNLNKEQTFTKTKLFFVNTFNSAKDVIQLDDKENGIVMGKGSANINIQSGKFSIPISMSFTIKIESKDGKCRLEVSNIIYNNESPAENFFNDVMEEKYSKANEKGKIVMENYRDKTIEKIDFLESKIKEEFYKKEQSW